MVPNPMNILTCRKISAPSNMAELICRITGCGTSSQDFWKAVVSQSMSRSVEKRIYELNWLIPTRGVVGAGPIVAPGPAGRHADDQITSKKAEVGMEVETAGTIDAAGAAGAEGAGAPDVGKKRGRAPAKTAAPAAPAASAASAVPAARDPLAEMRTAEEMLQDIFDGKGGKGAKGAKERRSAGEGVEGVVLFETVHYKRIF